MNTVNIDKLVTNGNIRIGNKKRLSSYKTLKDNIKSIGIMTPITVTRCKKEEGKYVIIDGHQRYSIAKDLKLAEIPYFIIENPIETEVNQASANMFNIPMSSAESSLVIKKMLERNEHYTKTDIQNLFGKSANWVKEAIQYTNLIPQFEKLLRFDNKSNSTLLELSTYNHNKQKQIYNNLKENDFNFKSNEFDMSDLLWEIERELRVFKVIDSETIFKVIPEETVRRYEKEYGYENKYSNSLFEDYSKDDICTDNDHILNMLYNETEIGKILKDLPIDESDNWNKDSVHIELEDFNNKRKFYSKIKSASGETFKNCNILSWNGSLKWTRIFWSVKKNNVESKSDDKTANPLDRIAGKYGKLIFPLVEGNINALNHHSTLFKKIGKKNAVLNCTFEWLRSRGSIFTFDSDGYNSKIKESNNYDFIDLFIEKWFNDNYENNSYTELDKLFESHKLNKIPFLVEQSYKNDEQFKRDYINLFTVNLLKPLVSKCKESNNDLNSKKSLVEFLVKNLNEQPYTVLHKHKKIINMDYYYWKKMNK